VSVYLPCNVRLSLPPTLSHRGGRGYDGTPTCRSSSGVKPITEQGASSYACSFDEDYISTTHAVFVFSLSSNSEKGGSKSGRTLSCHRPPVLEMAHLASSLVQPAGYIEAEATPSPSSVPWRFGLCQLSLGLSLSTSNPDQKDLRPKGPPSSLPGSWSAITTKEAGSTNQSSSSSPRSKALALCSRFWRFWRFWRGATLYAHGLLGCTNYGSIGPTRCSAGLSSF
jgi:hypothetical protein